MDLECLAYISQIKEEHDLGYYLNTLGLQAIGKIADTANYGRIANNFDSLKDFLEWIE